MSNTLITASIIAKAFLMRLNDELPLMKSNAVKERDQQERIMPLKTEPRGIIAFDCQFKADDLALEIVDYEEKYLVPAAKAIAAKLIEAGASQTCWLEMPSAVSMSAQQCLHGVACRVLKTYNVKDDTDEIRIDVGYA